MSIPTWANLALLASLLFSIANVLDQTILIRYRLTPWIYFALDGFIGVIPIAIVLVFSENAFLVGRGSIILAILSGVALASFNLFYFFALQLSSVAVVVILMQMSSVFSLIWAILFLHEHYNISTYFGMFLVLVGVSVAAVSEETETVSGSRSLSRSVVVAAFWMLIAALALSIAYLMQDMALKDSDVLSVFFWQRACLVFISALIVIVRWKDISQMSVAPIVLTSLVEVAVVSALLCITAALATGPLAAVSFLSSAQPVWTVMIVWVLSWTGLGTRPNNTRLSWLRLVVATLLVISGVYLIG